MLKQIVLRQKIKAANASLDALRAKDQELETRAAAMKTREAELEAAVNEIKVDTPAEDKAIVDAQVEAYEADNATLVSETEAQEAAKKTLTDEIEKLQAELDEIENRHNAEPAAKPAPKDERKDTKMNHRKFFNMNAEQRDAFFARSEVKEFLSNVRAIKTRGVTNGSLTIPDIFLETLRDNLEQYSKLAKFVNVKRVNGTARQNIMGAAPEGVWMEATGALNELDMSLNQIEVDGYMVGGLIWVHNTLLEDSDIALGAEIMDQLGMAVGKGVDRGILYGTGTKTPIGIVTRLAQTSQPSGWGTYAPAWTDLHTSNVLKLNINSTTGATFFASLIAALGVAKPNYTNGGAFWVMNRKTHINIMAKALAFDAAAALLAGVNNQMPIIGGEIVELEIVGDNEIVGGYGSAYLLAEREGAKIEASEHARFQQMQTGIRGYARYDGMPVFGEAFVVVSFDNTDAATTSTFQTDYANSDIGALTVASAAGTTLGDTKLTITGAAISGTTLKYKVANVPVSVVNGSKPVGFTAWDGTDDITAATGTYITVVELNSAGKAIKVGSCIVTAKDS